MTFLCLSMSEICVCMCFVFFNHGHRGLLLFGRWGCSYNNEWMDVICQCLSHRDVLLSLSQLQHWMDDCSLSSFSHRDMLLLLQIQQWVDDRGLQAVPAWHADFAARCAHSLGSDPVCFFHHMASSGKVLFIFVCYFYVCTHTHKLAHIYPPSSKPCIKHIYKCVWFD